MTNKMVFHVLIEKDLTEDAFVALCLDLDIAAQGETKEKAVAELKEAVNLYIKCVLNDKDYKALFRPAPKEEWDKFFSKLPDFKEPHIELELISA